MVAIADWNATHFEIPESLRSFEASEARGIPTRREILSSDRFGGLRLVARDTCVPLHNAIWPLIEPRLQSLDVAVGRNQLVNAYNDVVLDLSSRQREWTTFLEQVWTFDGFDTIVAENEHELRFARDSRRSWLEQGLGSRAFKTHELQSIVTAEFVSRHGHDMKQLLVQDVHDLTIHVTQSCVQQLLDMVGLLSVGIVQWYPGSTCRYLFFRRGFYSSSKVESPTARDVFGRTTGEVECHEHHLMDAFACHPANAPVAVPASVQQLIDQAPGWVRSQLHLVNGTLTQETVNRLVVRDETWQVVRRVPRMHNDPALVIGPFVLAGWGPSDEEKGTLRRGLANGLGQIQTPPKSSLTPLLMKFFGGA